MGKKIQSIKVGSVLRTIGYNNFYIVIEDRLTTGKDRTICTKKGIKKVKDDRYKLLSEKGWTRFVERNPKGFHWEFVGNMELDVLKMLQNFKKNVLSNSEE